MRRSVTSSEQNGFERPPSLTPLAIVGPSASRYSQRWVHALKPALLCFIFCVQLFGGDASNSDLIRLKRFLHSPGTVEKIVFDQYLDPRKQNDAPGPKTRIEAARDPSGFIIQIVDSFGGTVEHGSFKHVPWTYNPAGVEYIKYYETYTKPVQKQADETGLPPGGEVLSEVLGCGIFTLKPGSLNWKDDEFTAIVNGRVPILGFVTNFNARGLPTMLHYEFERGTLSSDVRLTYSKNPELPSFFPTEIERRFLPSNGKPPVPVSRYIVHQLTVSTNPLPSARLNPASLHPQAMVLYHTNNTDYKAEGDRRVRVDYDTPLPVEKEAHAKLLVFLAIALAFAVLTYKRFRRNSVG